MFCIAKADLYRLWHEKLVKIALIVTAIFVLMSPFPADRFFAHFNVEYGEPAIQATGSTAFQNIGFDGYVNLFIPLIIVAVFSSEFTKHTFLNIAGAKISKRKIFLGKFLSFSIALVILMLYSAILTTIEYTALSGWGSSFSLVQIVHILLIALLVAFAQIAYSWLTILLSAIIHNSATLVVLYFSASLVESVFSSICINLSEDNVTILNIPVFDYLAYVFPSTYLYDLTKIQLSGTILTMILVPLACYILITVVVGQFLYSRIEL